VVFKSKQLGDCVYHVSGRGLLPKLMPPTSISASAGSTNSNVIQFMNPTDSTVLADIKLTENDQLLREVRSSIIQSRVTTEPAFSILTHQKHNLEVEPYGTVDIPFAFNPCGMLKYFATIAVSIKRTKGRLWPDEYEDEDDSNQSSMEQHEQIKPTYHNDGILAIRYVYPVHGIPHIKMEKPNGEEATVFCQARSQVSDRLEVSLVGATPSVADGRSLIRVTKDDKTKSRFSFDVFDGHRLNEEFHYEFFYGSDKSRREIENCLKIELVGKTRNPSNGIVILTFLADFSPLLPMNHITQLLVTSVTGGSWVFPLRIKAGEPEPDDKIVVESKGVGQTSAVTFLLDSKTEHPVPFEAFFSGDSDSSFAVSPCEGILLTKKEGGIKITISFTPGNIGKKYKGLLVVKTTEMQWSYEILGKFPRYMAPVVKTKTDCGQPKTFVAHHHRNKTNYLKNNLKLLSTAASSPVKGKPIMKSFI